MSNINDFENLMKGASEFYTEYQMVVKEAKDWRIKALDEVTAWRKLEDSLLRIANVLEIEWTDGEFPIEQVLAKINNARR